MTIWKDYPAAVARLLPGRLGNLPGGRSLNWLSRPHWFRPNGSNLDAMVERASAVAASGCSYLQFMLHSSELMPGGSPTFPDSASIERLYDHLERLFESTRHSFTGSTLAGFRDRFAAHDAGDPAGSPALLATRMA